MVQDSPSFQSQQYVQGIQEQSANRQERYVDRYAQSRQQIADVPMRFMQARGMAMEQQRMQQEQQMRLSQVASDLANDQLHRQQALEDLQWSQQLHQADMIGLQKRGMAAEIELKEAQAKKALEALGENDVNDYWKLNQYERDTIIAEHGLMGVPRGRNNVDMVDATDEQRSAARQRKEAEDERRQAYRLQQIMMQGAMRGLVDDSRQGSTGINQAGKRLEQINEVIANKEFELRNIEDPSQRAMAEQELIGLRRTAKQLGDKIDQSLLGGEQQPATQKSDMTVDDFLSRQSADALKILYPDGK